MPYYITNNNPECTNWAVEKDDGEVIACHNSKEEAIAQMVAISLAEEIEPGGERNNDYEPAIIVDIDGTLIIDGRPNQKLIDYLDTFDDTEIFIVTARLVDERDATINQLETFDIDYDRLIMKPNDEMDSADYKEEVAAILLETYNVMLAIDNDPENRARFRKLGITALDVNEIPDTRAPAPPEEQIEGSDKNEPGSAAGAGGDIEISAQTETALRNKVTEHNDKMKEENKPDYTRTTFGQLAAVYRRGAGAYSTSHRPGMTRNQWAMGRVNAYLYLLANGRPRNPNYITDNDLLPEGHPLSTRSIRQINLEPPAYMRAAARQGLKYYEEGLGGDGLVPRTIREARAMANGTVTADKWVRIRAWIARHMPDLDSPDANPNSERYPSPGVVAHLLWGSGPSKAAARRALDYAEGVVSRIEAENEGRAKGEALSKIETRTQTTSFEIRESETGGMLFEGYAAVFNSPSEPLPFTERIAPGAFRGSLKQRNDIKMLWNHDTGAVLGSTRAKTLELYEDEKGLRVRAQLPNTTLGRDTAELIRRGDVNAMSFGFSVAQNGDSWNDAGTERTLTKVRLHEVSIVAFPAYTATAGTASVRGLDKIAKRADVDADELADALLKIESGNDITVEEKSMIMKVLDTLAPQVSTPQDEFDGQAWLALKKKKLETLIKKA